MDPDLTSLMFSRRSLVFMYLGVAIAFLCWGLSAFPPTSPDAYLEVLAVDLAQLESDVASLDIGDDRELPGRKEQATEIAFRTEKLSNSLVALRYYESALTVGRFAGILIHLIAAWSQIGPVVVANLRDPGMRHRSRIGQTCCSPEPEKSAIKELHGSDRNAASYDSTSPPVAR